MYESAQADDAKMQVLAKLAKQAVESYKALAEYKTLTESDDIDVKTILSTLEDATVTANEAMDTMLKPYAESKLSTIEYVNFVQDTVNAMSKEFKDVSTQLKALADIAKVQAVKLKADWFGQFKKFFEENIADIERVSKKAIDDVANYATAPAVTESMDDEDDQPELNTVAKVIKELGSRGYTKGPVAKFVYDNIKRFGVKLEDLSDITDFPEKLSDILGYYLMDGTEFVRDWNRIKGNKYKLAKIVGEGRKAVDEYVLEEMIDLDWFKTYIKDGADYKLDTDDGYGKAIMMEIHADDVNFDISNLKNPEFAILDKHFKEFCDPRRLYESDVTTTSDNEFLVFTANTKQDFRR
jgi:hypothetical protein